MAGIFLSVLLMFKRDWLTALAFTPNSLLVLVDPPLLSFALFFCVMHSARHALRTQHYASVSWRQLLLTGLAPTAALTAPYMVLVERVRFSGWVKPH